MNFDKWSKSLLYSYQEQLNFKDNNLNIDKILNEDDEENNYGEEYDYYSLNKISIEKKKIPNYLTNRLCHCNKCLIFKENIRLNCCSFKNI